MSKQSQLQRSGEAAWAKMPKVNGELFALTYGAIVTHLIKDFEDFQQVNRQLDAMGYNIGIRLIDEFLAKTNTSACQDFKETMDVVSKVAFRMFLGINVDVGNWNPEMTCCHLVITENPLSEYVELPPQAAGVLSYSNILAGIIRGALENIQMKVEVAFVKDELQGDDTTELRVEMKGMIGDSMGEDYRED